MGVQACVRLPGAQHTYSGVHGCSDQALAVFAVQPAVGSVCTVHLPGKHRADAAKAHVGPGGCWDSVLRREGLELGGLGIVSLSPQ